MNETEHLHTVTITGDEEQPKIEFTCHGDRDAECHSYPDCDCPSWPLGESVDDAGHPFVPHDNCWMKSLFDNAEIGHVYPASDTLDDFEMTVGMSGPIEAHFDEDYLEWEFIEQAAEQRAQAAQQYPMFSAGTS